MNAEQKRAWLGVWSIAGCLVGFAILIPFIWASRAICAFCLFSVNGFAPLIGRREMPYERDTSIGRHATLGGAMASYMAFIIGCMGTWIWAFAWHGRQQVPVHLLAEITMGGGIVFYLVRSIAVLVMYGRHLEADDA